MRNTLCGSADLPFLPKDVLIHILVQLPVISLLRFKSVCKSWRALIESSFFIDLHTTTTFNSSSSSSKFDSFIIQTSFKNTYTVDSEFFMLSSGPRSGSGDWYKYWVTHEDDYEFNHDDVVFKIDRLGFPSCYEFSICFCDIFMVGSFNGLVCIHNSKLREISLCNPATGQVRILPKSLTVFEEEEEGIVKFNHDFVAFGFDVKTKDYKVVQITGFTPIDRRASLQNQVQVYSLSTDSWRLLEGINTLPAKPVWGGGKKGIYLNGSCFFEGRIYTYNNANDAVLCPKMSIVSFDFTKEIFTTIQLPDLDLDHDDAVRYRFSLSRLGDKLALITTLPWSSSLGPQSRCIGCHHDYENYDIWVLNEHGGGGGVNKKESWSKLHSFQIKNLGLGDCTIPRGISKNGEFVLLENRCLHTNKKMQLFNLVTKEANKDFLICHTVLSAEVYKPSLVSIIGGNGGAVAADRDD